MHEIVFMTPQSQQPLPSQLGSKVKIETKSKRQGERETLNVKGPASVAAGRERGGEGSEREREWEKIDRKSERGKERERREGEMHKTAFRWEDDSRTKTRKICWKTMKTMS
jgi:hypothetical protein